MFYLSSYKTSLPAYSLSNLLNPEISSCFSSTLADVCFPTTGTNNVSLEGLKPHSTSRHYLANKAEQISLYSIPFELIYVCY